MILTRWIRWTAVLALVAVPLGVATRGHAAATGSTEVRRIQTHFDSVLTELGGRDLGRLTAKQRAHRATLVAELRRYRDRGVFPHNYDFPDRPTPYFIDRKTGTLCAVANLLAASGRRDIVDRVARANNNVWVDDLAGDTAFTRWLDANGLTLHEAARIQVPYMAPQTPAQVARQASYLTVAPLSIIASTTFTLWNVTSNADGHRGGARWAGMIAGATGAAAGALLMAKPSNVQDKFGPMGIASFGLGFTSMVAAGTAMHRHNVILAAQRDSTHRAVMSEASIGPVVTPNGGTGLGMSFKF